MALVAPLWALTGCVTSGAPKPMIRTPEAAAGAPAAAVARLTEKECGATYTLTEGNQSGSGAYVVSVYPEAGRSEDVDGLPSAQVVQAFIDHNRDLLTVDGHAVGTWCEPNGGKASDCRTPGQVPTCHLDISRVVASLDEAQRLAFACNQRAIAWLKYDGVEILDNGGRGYGDGKKLTGPALDVCRKARGD